MFKKFEFWMLTVMVVATLAYFFHQAEWTAHDDVVANLFFLFMLSGCTAPFFVMVIRNGKPQKTSTDDVAIGEEQVEHPTAAEIINLFPPDH